MKLKDVMAALKAKGSESTKRILLKHGAKEPFFGVKVADLKTIAKPLKGAQALALELYATGNGDAQYLAGMLADGRQMTAAQLQAWAESASWDVISGYTVPWVAVEHPDGFKLAVKWTKAKAENVARAGWSTLAGLAAVVPDPQLPVAEFGELLDRVPREIPAVPDGVRSAMNHFVIAVGTYVAPLGPKAIATARRLGKVEVDQGETACRLPDAEAYILKSRRGAASAPKRKTIRC